MCTVKGHVKVCVTVMVGISAVCGAKSVFSFYTYMPLIWFLLWVYYTSCVISEKERERERESGYEWAWVCIQCA